MTHEQDVTHVKGVLNEEVPKAIIRSEVPYGKSMTGFSWAVEGTHRPLNVFRTYVDGQEVASYGYKGIKSKTLIKSLKGHFYNINKSVDSLED